MRNALYFACQTCWRYACCKTVTWTKRISSQMDGALLSVIFIIGSGHSLLVNEFKPMLKNELGYFSCSHFDISSLSFQTQLNRVSEPCWSSACLESLKLPNCLAPLSVSHAISQKANNLSLSRHHHVPEGK